MSAIKPSRLTLYAVALVCFANLLLEIVLTRIYSATMFYHFTFLAIALALFGLGASGVYVYLREDELERAPLDAELAKYARRFAGATILLVVYVLANPMDILIVTGTNQAPLFTKKAFLQLMLLIGFSSLPFFYSGMVVSLAVTRFREDINRLYFFDLVGAAVAALLAGLLLGLFGGPSLVILIALLAVVGAAMFERPRGLGWAPAVIVAGLLTLNLTTQIISVPTTKGVKADKVAFEGWNVFSRITVDDKLNIKIDASAATEISSTAKITPVRPVHEITSLAHALYPAGAGRVLIIGPGGGRDVVHALSSGAKRVTGVEINPLIARTVMQEKFREQSGGLYFDPRVEIIVADGRSYVRAASERFDVIQASLVDTWAATAAGAFALTENNLYTMEAFQDYYGHLTENGALTMTRWHSGARGETARLLLLAAGTLERLGVPAAQTRQHIFYAVKDSLGTMVAKRSAFNEEELGLLEEACRAGGFKIVVSPRSEASDALPALIDAGAWSAAVTRLTEDLSPPTDDRPFFFYFSKVKDLWKLEGRIGGPMNDPSLWMLVSLLAVSLLTVSFIVVPLFLKGMPTAAAGDDKAAYRRPLALGYFGLLGLAFIVVEIAMLQKLTFFLGHPSYALLVVLFSILVATAFGARLSGRISEAKLGRTLLVAGGALALLIAAYSFVLGTGLRSLVGWPVGARMVLSALLVAAPGCLMGLMLPSGIRMLSRRDAALVPWAWGLNGATSVIGTVGATVIAIHVGFAGTLIIGAGGYLVAALAAYELHRVTR